jgi:glycosyltransferase involved in cell wall biosynthesis
MTDVVVVSDAARPDGGNSMVALASAMGLARRGHRVIFFSGVANAECAQPELEAAPSLEFVATNQHPILEDPSRLRASLRGLWNLSARYKFARILDRLDPSRTVIHLHGWSKVLSASVIACAFRRGFKVICTLHDFFIACPNGGFFDYQNQEICHRTPLSANCLLTHCDARKYSHKVWRVARQLVQSRFGGLPQCIRDFVAPSALSDRILRPFLPSHARIHHVRNPIDVERADPARPDANDPFVVVGRLSPEKGPELVARAAALAGVSVVFVGDGPLRANVERINPRIRVTGWLGRGEVVEQLRAARALVYASLWYETNGLSVLEAAAVGLPAIVSDACAARELVVDRVTGLHFESGSVRDLADKLRRLQDASLARLFGARSYARYWGDPPTVQRHAAELERVYECALAS